MTAERPPEGPSSVADVEIDRGVPINAISRFATMLVASVFMLVTGIVVARNLGPAAKGVVATATYVAAASAVGFSFGLGPAFVVAFRSRQDHEQVGAPATIAGALVSGGLAGVATAAASLFVFFAGVPDRHGLALAVGAVTWLLVLTAAYSGILEATGRIIGGGIAQVIMAAVAAGATAWLLLGRGGGVLAAVIAQLLGAAAGCGYLALTTARLPLRSRPVVDLRYLRRALRVGGPLGGGELLRVLARRVDVVVVYGLAGPGAAGLYSVAVTWGELVTYAPAALRVATFPNAAGVETVGAHGYVARITRLGLLAALVAAVPLAVSTPWLLPALFGRGFAPAIVAALVLVAAAIVSAGQAALTYALAARGRPTASFKSYAGTVVAMILLDLVLVPMMGVAGAALASLAAAATGMWIAVRAARVSFPGARLRLVPGRVDVHELVAALSGLARSATARAGLRR